MSIVFIEQAPAQKKVITALRQRLKGVVPAKQEKVYVDFARRTMDAMTKIKNWEDLTSQQRDMIVRSIVDLARTSRPIFAEEGFEKASKKLKNYLESKDQQDYLGKVTPAILSRSSKAIREQIGEDARVLIRLFFDEIQARPSVLLSRELNKTALQLHKSFSQFDSDARSIAERYSYPDAPTASSSVRSIMTAHVQELIRQPIYENLHVRLRQYDYLYTTAHYEYTGEITEKQRGKIRKYVRSLWVCDRVTYIYNIWFRTSTACDPIFGGAIPKPIEKEERRRKIRDEFDGLRLLRTEHGDIVPFVLNEDVPEEARTGQTLGVKQQKTPEERSEEALKQARKTKRLSSLLTGWLGAVAVDRTPPVDSPIGRKTRRQVYSELAGPLGQAEELGGHIARKKMTPLQQQALDLFLEFVKLPMTSGQQRWGQQLEKKYKKFLQRDFRHARKVKTLVARLKRKINGNIEQGEESGEAYVLRFLGRVRFLLSFLRDDIMSSRGEVTDGQRRKLRRRIEDGVQKLKAIGVFQKSFSGQEKEVEKLPSIERALMNYIQETRRNNPVLDNIEENVEAETLREAYRQYVANGRSTAEAEAYNRLREMLVKEVGEASLSERARRRAEYLAHKLLGQIYKENPELKKKAFTARKASTSVKRALCQLDRAGFFEEPKRFQMNGLGVEDSLARALATYLAACKTHDSPMLNLNRTITDLELYKVYEKHRKKLSGAEKKAAKNFKNTLLKQIRLVVR